MAERAAELVKEALAQLAIADITYGVGRCDLAAHRDFRDVERKLFACCCNPAAPADDTLLVARVTGTDGRLLTSVVNYACHPTTLAWDSTLISPDYIGALHEVVEHETGASYLPLRELYRTGIYQETMAVVAPGSLEQLLESVAARIAASIRS